MQHIKMEPETRRLLIDPKLRQQGWEAKPWMIHWEWEVNGRGRIKFGGESHTRRTALKADYVLRCREGVEYAVIEAKRADLDVLDAKEQAIDYAFKGGVPVAYATNGHEIRWFIVLDIGEDEPQVTHMGKIDNFHTPEELYEIYIQAKNLEEHRSKLGPLEHSFYVDPTRIGDRGPRYFQTKAINNTIELLIKGENRILLAMATGTGKTYTAAQLAYKLIKSGKYSKILFLVDRTNLREQAYGEFKTIFKSDELFEWEPGVELSTHRNIYFAIYQTLVGLDDEGNVEGAQKLYETIPANFFDLIIIDECHRGKKQDTEDEGAGIWFKLLEYFGNIPQVGLTATPKKEESNDTYEYFRNIAITYSVKNGIDDGYLAPFILKKAHTNIDRSGIKIEEGLIDVAGNPVPPGLYGPSKFNTLLLIPARIKLYAEKLVDHLLETGLQNKTIVFCVDQKHAADMAEAINTVFEELKQENPVLQRYSGVFAKRITGKERSADGSYPDLIKFQNTARNSPIVATTSKLLTTGANIVNLKNVVFFRQVNSLVEFKQMIGRGTRIYIDQEDDRRSKYGFYVIEYGNTSTDFLDGDWDGTPEDIIPGPPRESTPRIREERERIIHQMEESFMAGEIEIAHEEESYMDVNTNKKITEAEFLTQQSALFREEIGSFEEFKALFKDLPSIVALFKKISEDTDINQSLLRTHFRKKYERIDVDIFDVINHVIYQKDYLPKIDRVEKTIFNKQWYNDLSTVKKSITDSFLRNYIDYDFHFFQPNDLFWKRLKSKGLTLTDIEKQIGEDELYSLINMIVKDLYETAQ